MQCLQQQHPVDRVILYILLTYVSQPANLPILYRIFKAECLSTMERVNIFKNNTCPAVRLPKAVTYPGNVWQVDPVVQGMEKHPVWAYPPNSLPLPAAPLFFLDYDGTLAPIVDNPKAGYPHPDVPELLQRLSAEHPVYIVTGRHLRDLYALLPKTLILSAIGLHGAQEGCLHGEVQERLTDIDRQALATMRATVPDLKGVWVEDKKHMFAVHYRKAPEPAAARQSIKAWADKSPEVLMALWGKDVVELRPTHLHKGTAVTAVYDKYPEHTPIYLGDDVTDEDAFNALPDDAVTVKVGGGATAARFRLPDIEAVVVYLKRFTR